MGQSNSNPFREGGDLMSEYSIEGRQLEQSLTFLSHKKTKKEYLLREQTFNDLREFALASERLKKRQTISSPHLTNLVRIEERTEDHLCSNFYKIYSLWEHSSKSLTDEITARALEKKPFNGAELQSILACSIVGLAALQEAEVRHESLTPRAMLIDPEGKVKIVEPLAQGLITNIDSVYNNRSIKHIYLSPQQCQSVETQKPIINKNPYKNDVFVLGMIMLECALLERQDHCYLHDYSEVNFERVQTNLKRFSELYDGELSSYVVWMLSRDIRDRPDWVELLKHVNRNKMDKRASQAPRRDHFITRVAAGDAGPRKEQPNVSQQQSARPVPMAEPPQSIFYKQQQTYIPPVSTIPAPTYVSQQQKIKSFQLPQSETIQFPMQTTSVLSKPQEFTYRPAEINNIPLTNNNSNPFTVTFNGTSSYQTQPPSYFVPSLQPQQQQQVTISQKFVPTPFFSGTFSKEGFSSIPFTNDKHSISSNLTAVLDQVRPQETSPPSHYVKAAQSINYEIPKTQSPLQERTPLTYHMDPKLTKTPQLGDHSQLEMQPTFVEEHFKMGSRYQGFKLNGQRHGRGKFFYQDGGSYDGQWKENKMEGQGTLYYQSNRIAYEGGWVADKFQGFGKLYNEFPQPLQGSFDCTDFDAIDEYWAYYEGNFNEDLKDGHGVLKFSNGETFQGTFREDMVEGQGIFYCRDGRRIHGIWHENHLEQELQS